jgi:molecular chaperone GrpE
MAKTEHPDDKWQKFSEQGEDDPAINEEQDADNTEMEEETAVMSEEDGNDDALTAVTMERDALKDQLMRSKAEMDNLRRRNERDVSNAHKYGSEKLLKDLLPVMDSLIRGLEGDAPEEPHAQALYKGMELTLDLLEKTLQKHGITMIDPAAGETFNPEQHEAMSMQQNPDFEADTVLQVLQKGFELNGRVLRAAMVIVNQK